MLRIILEGIEGIDIDLSNDKQIKEIKEKLKDKKFQARITAIQILDNKKKYKAQLVKPEDDVIWSIGKIGYTQFYLNKENKDIQTINIGESISYHNSIKNHKQILKHYSDGKIVRQKIKYKTEKV